MTLRQFIRPEGARVELYMTPVEAGDARDGLILRTIVAETAGDSIIFSVVDTHACNSPTGVDQGETVVFRQTAPFRQTTPLRKETALGDPILRSVISGALDDMRCAKPGKEALSVMRLLGVLVRAGEAEWLREFAPGLYAVLTGEGE
jgi:hypothetical protein